MVENIETLVPCCDHVVTITVNQILRGIMHMKLGETRGNVFVGCPSCSTALVMSPDMPTDMPLFQKWVIANENNPDWNPCVPFLDDRILMEPAGTVTINGKTMYRAGSGGVLLNRYDYMLTYGIDPEMVESKRPHAEPVVLG